MSIKHVSYSFAKGMLLVDKSEESTIKKEISAIIGSTDRTTFSRRKKSYMDIPVHVYQEITEVFCRRGLSEEDVWIIKDA